MRSSSVIITFAIKEPKGDPIDTSSICSYNFLLKEKEILEVKESRIRFEILVPV